MNIRSGLAVLLAVAACRSSSAVTTAASTAGDSGLERVSLLAKGLE